MLRMFDENVSKMSDEEVTEYFTKKMNEAQTDAEKKAVDKAWARVVAARAEVRVEKTSIVTPSNKNEGRGSGHW